MTLDLEEARTDHLNFAAVEALFHELEFRTLINRLLALKRGYNPPVAAAAGSTPGQQLSLFGEQVTRIGERSCHLPANPHRRQSRRVTSRSGRKLAAAPEIAFDTETTSTDPLRADLVGISLAVGPGEGYYIPVGHTTGEPQLPLEQVIDALRPALTDPKIPKIGHNLKYDMLVLSAARAECNPAHLRYHDRRMADRSWLASPGA